MRESFDPALIAVSAAALIATIWIARCVSEPFCYRALSIPRWIEITVIGCAAGLVGAMVGQGWMAAAVSMAFLILLAQMAALVFGRLSGPGAIFVTLPPVSMAAGGAWAYLWMVELGFPNWSFTVFFIGLAAAVCALPYLLTVAFAQNAIYTHRRWSRPTAPLEAAGLTPKVSIHLPCHAEPPEVVLATINALSRLDYPDFEVLVCDNNTPDPAQWRPLEARCAALNERLGAERFRFFHVEGLEGAKAGALNLCLQHTDPAADLVALVDADYVAAPDFLARLVGFFDDDRIGFVQTSHDYRDGGESVFKAMCYREYMPNYKVAMPGANEYHGAFTIGTMCVFRRAGLEAVGGWAEWCLTEDSEIAVRLRAAGYDGAYLRDTFGQGLIPEHFGDYRKQRFRWTAGPVQQLRRHWRLYLPSVLLGRPNRMRAWAKVMELQHSLGEMTVLATPMAWIVAPVFVLLTVGGAIPAISLPRAFWIALLLAAGTQALQTWLTYRLAGSGSVRAVLGGVIARQALLLIRIQAVVAGLFSRRPLQWRRTPKVAPDAGSLRRVLSSTWMETLLGALALGCAAIPLLATDALGLHLPIVLSVAFTVTALRLLCAPLVAAFGEVEIIRRTRRQRPEAPVFATDGRDAAAAASLS